MIKLIPQGSKLIFIFILTVIISGGILTYLSITHISNYRELLEKKISEEQREMSNRFSLTFQAKLDTLTIQFSDYLKTQDSLIVQNLKTFNKVNGVVNYLAKDQTGTFLAPNVTNNKLHTAKRNISSSYLELNRTAERYEFSGSENKKAAASYLKALRAAISKTDSAQIYNSLGRLYLKMDLEGKAFKSYQTILSTFQNTANSSGFPYSYFSVIKLLNIDAPHNLEEFEEAVLLFLSGLDDGTIPLNDSSPEVLEQIEAWQKKHRDNLQNDLFNPLIAQIREAILLVSNYKAPLENLAAQKKDVLANNQNVEYLWIKPTLGGTRERLLFIVNEPISAGLVIGLDQLFMEVLQSQKKDNQKFEYELKLIEKNSDNYLIHKSVITSHEFSPYFDNNLLQVSLKNENIIDEKVTTKQFTYGIGLVIFIGTMMLGLYLLIQDVKREKRMKELQADFVSNVTHELKTPLTAINMFAEAMNMSKDKLDEKQKRYTTIIVKESEKLKGMINNILEFSKKENDKLSYKLVRSNVTDIVNSTLNEMNYFLEINKIHVDTSIANDMYANVHAEGIKQALSNLLSNAIKYSSSNKKMTVRLFKKENEIYIEVEDFGIGIPKDKLEHIFEKFYRVNANETETVSGTGLGLTVTKDIIEEQNGKLLVESVLGEGSKFSIVLHAA